MRHQLAPPAVDTELGADRRADATRSHGGMPVPEFVAHAMAGLDSGDDEVLVGAAARMKAAPDELFAAMNRR
jgi:uncharacterized oxidoreductase